MDAVKDAVKLRAAVDSSRGTQGSRAPSSQPARTESSSRATTRGLVTAGAASVGLLSDSGRDTVNIAPILRRNRWRRWWHTAHQRTRH